MAIEKRLKIRVATEIRLKIMLVTEIRLKPSVATQIRMATDTNKAQDKDGHRKRTKDKGSYWKRMNGDYWNLAEDKDGHWIKAEVKVATEVGLRTRWLLPITMQQASTLTPWEACLAPQAIYSYFRAPTTARCINSIYHYIVYDISYQLQYSSGQSSSVWFVHVRCSARDSGPRIAWRDNIEKTVLEANLHSTHKSNILNHATWHLTLLLLLTTAKRYANITYYCYIIFQAGGVALQVSRLLSCSLPSYQALRSIPVPLVLL